MAGIEEEGIVHDQENNDYDSNMDSASAGEESHEEDDFIESVRL